MPFLRETVAGEGQGALPSSADARTEGKRTMTRLLRHNYDEKWT